MRKLALFAALLSAPLCLGGCLTPSEAIVTDQYVITPQPQAAPVAEQLALTLGIRELEAARPYHISIARMESDGKLSYYNQSIWADYPAAAVTRALRDAIVRTNRFHDAGMAEQMARPDLMLVGYLTAFHEDRTVTPAQAVVAVRLELRQARGTALLWSADLRETEPLATTGAAGLTAAMTAAVERLITQAAGEIAAVPRP
jgi:ABC-type uncharacterized transport system auxiliary subunit